MRSTKATYTTTTTSRGNAIVAAGSLCGIYHLTRPDIQIRRLDGERYQAAVTHDVMLLTPRDLELQAEAIHARSRPS